MTLCNACGLRHAKRALVGDNGLARPLSKPRLLPTGAFGVPQVRGFQPPLALLNGLNHGPGRSLINAMTVVAPPTNFIVLASPPVVVATRAPLPATAS